MSQPIALNTLRKEPAYRREAFSRGLERLGYKVIEAPVGAMTQIYKPTSPDDLLVLWNKKRGHEEQQADRWEKLGGTVIVTENAYLQKVDKTAYAISTHGHNGSGWFPQVEKGRFEKLGYELKPWRTDGKYILVCGQRGIGSELMASPPQWAEKIAQRYKDPGAPVKLRQHPGNHAPKVPLLTDLADATHCLIWSSSAGVTALIEGVPVQHFAPHWICAGWGPLTREVALNFMANGQWSVAEIESAEPFARMRDAGWGPRWS